MPRPNRQLPTVQLDLFRSPSPQRLNWLGLTAEVREKVTRLIRADAEPARARQSSCLQGRRRR
jgi:hypothetical protein